MVDVFISYSRDNQAMVRRLAEAVKAEGYSIWWDDELPPHLAYGDVITEKIGSARAAIVVWSQSAAASEWVRAEADVARNQKKLIQTSIDGHSPPLPFNQIQFAAIGDWQGEADHPGWRKVKESLAALCGPGDARPPAYPMPAGPPPAAATAPAPPHKWHKLLIAVIAVAALFVAGAGLFAWMRGNAPAEVAAPAPAPVTVGAAPAAPPEKRFEPAPPPQPARAPMPAEAAPPPRQKAQPPQRQAAPVNLRQARRYCMGRGRGTPECAQLRRQYLGY
jgi:hypothetical protein